MAEKTTWIGVPCTKQAPTKNHRPAIWEMMLGTVQAMNDKGKVQYFDYDWDAAKAFAGVNDGADRDPRLYRYDRRKMGTLGIDELDRPHSGRPVLWVKRGAK